ncbi:T9SS C-terminal target domain-containing protein [Hymenobacter sediminis]|uniref:L-type lectin-domain containing protein n=1 Tax=Hymenobacter sediminis TaxID=2218621 RepID=UPI000DA69886|nr:T9SS type A sorting domain-containing protein [Hymenobacter sediminis]RPD49347.1 T9SS C-terminal target domain-containing protein [Hymenobacter sediminis]
MFPLSYFGHNTPCASATEVTTPGSLSVRRFLWGSALVAGMGLFQATTAQAQTNLYQLNGDATVGTGCSAKDNFIVVPNAGNKTGSVWRLQQLSLAKSFTIQFQTYHGNNDGGGDGMMFALQRNPSGTSVIGGGAQNMGMAAIAPSIAVEFDIYNNAGNIGDIEADHIAITKNGEIGKPLIFTTPAGGTAQAIAAKVNSVGSPVNIEDGAYHQARIVWNASTQTMQVYYDNALRVTYTENLVRTVFGNNPLVYWGFTASTGGATAQQEVCSISLQYDHDNDGLVDDQDADDDNDGIADAIESGDARANNDDDNDGVLNYEDADYGPLNAKGVVARLDTDGDGIINQFDLDSDNDGIPDVVEGTDGQMSTGFRAIYSAANGNYTSSVDGSGRPQNTSGFTTLPDTDKDGTPDFLDPNSDGDAAADWKEAFDDNSNGVSVDDFRARAAAFVAAGGNTSFYPNTDPKNSGAPEWLNDSNANGIPNFLDPTSTFFHDTDLDGLVDLLDPSSLGKAYADVSGIPDYNANGLTDYRDALIVTPLPVQLLSFTAREAGLQAVLTWATATELNNAYFVVEASPDAHTFTAVSEIAGAGTSSQRREYRYTDVNLMRYATATVYYRLRQVDQNGKVQYSPVQPVAVSSVSATLVAEPNPVTDVLTLELRGTLAGPAHLVVVNAAGQTQLAEDVVLTSGITTLRVPQAVRWPRGVYWVQVVQGQQRFSTKVVRQ